MRACRHHGSRRGFTLLEVLIVLAIIGVIAAMALPRLFGQKQLADIKSTKIAIHELESSADLYAVDSGYPMALQQLLQPRADNSEPVLDKIPIDAWGSPLNYEYPNTKATTKTSRPAIWSNGPDKQNNNGSGDDINNWDDLAKL